MAQRINKAIELLEQGQPIYYSGVESLTYEGGLQAAKTWADYLTVDMEHGAFDMGALDAFMAGLAAGGPTASGHRTPAVIVTLPVEGNDEAVMRANTWQVKQVLARGVHGLLLCHAESAAAVRTFVEAARFPFHSAGLGALGEGRRGAGGQGHAAAIWGISTQEYLELADVWPLNPKGELMLGLKIENRHALANVDATTAVPGIAFAEWGPGDMGFSFGHRDAHDPPYPPEMAAAQKRVKEACDRAKLAFLNGVQPDNVVDLLDWGVKVCAATPQAAEIGRAHTKRTMPV
jgi:4-hydroxy-2-oxoheptanedioate aldolase